MHGYYAYNDGTSHYGINVCKHGHPGFPVSRTFHEKLRSLPNAGLRKAYVKNNRHNATA
jgi:hypothetical protein